MTRADTPNLQMNFPYRKLKKWYSQHGAALPWRQTDDPYRIWVSEIMLQQTQVSRVVDYFPRFIKRFPSVRALARANWRQVLPLWRGLGYYQRGKNLLAAAKVILEQYHGSFPNTAAELRSLPGVGEYTASAILSFAFQKPVPALDTNLYRVLQRFSGCLREGVSPRAQALFQSHPRSGAFLNHALMDVGRLLCTARTPECPQCPLRTECHYAQHHFETGARKPSKSTSSRSSQSHQLIEVGIACIHRDGKYLFGKRMRSKGGLWEFPGGKREKGESIRDCLKREIQEELGVEISVRPAFLKEEFVDGEYLFRLHFCRCQILRGRPKPFEHQKLEWVAPADFKKFEMPSKNRLALERLAHLRS